MTNKDPSKYQYDRSEYVVMPPVRKSEDGTLTTEPQPVDNWEFFTDGAYWDMCAVRPVGDRDFNSLNLFHVTNLKEGERLASLLNSHCAYSAQPTPPPIDVEALKREIAPILWRDWDDLIDKEQNAITAIVDHLAATGRLKV